MCFRVSEWSTLSLTSLSLIYVNNVLFSVSFGWLLLLSVSATLGPLFRTEIRWPLNDAVVHS